MLWQIRNNYADNTNRQKCQKFIILNVYNCDIFDRSSKKLHLFQSSQFFPPKFQLNELLVLSFHSIDFCEN